uniref:Endonuclease/exonuclease/phosphatase domain-containing protein n=1 Tax=uncultured marine group II/III euryarchaeote KM3_92_B07 TaxID=1456543 RepID=A0A075I450_9EURY|nr:hypothetical protein [uncultured marine group II/III euryarchaeote KM3_92_B07]
MKVVNVNTNRGAHRLKSNLLKFDADIILIQEWADHKSDRSSEAAGKFSEYPFITATRYLLTLSTSSAEIVHSSDRLLVTRHSCGLIINSYSPGSGSGKLRREHLQELKALIDSLGETPVLISGDFNMAPRLEDGWHGRNHSPYTSKGERVAFDELLEDHGLADLGATVRWESTFERMNKGKLTSFRCDLALVNATSINSWSIAYDHDFRKKKEMSDHSALILDYEV